MRDLLLVVIALCACSEKKQEAKPEPAPPAPPSNPQARVDKAPKLPPPTSPTVANPSAPRGEGTADVDMSGALEKRLDGAKAVCAKTVLPGHAKPQGMSIRVDTGDFTLTILAVTEEELADPKMILNITKPVPKSFAKPVRAGLIRFETDSKATIDVELRAAEGKETVRVKGTIECQPT